MQSAFGLAKRLQISEHSGGELLKSYFDRFSKISEFYDEVKELADRTTYTFSMFKRSRRLPLVKSSNAHVRNAAYRMVVNHVMQATSADLLKMNMIMLYDLRFKDGYDIKFKVPSHDGTVSFCGPTVPKDEICEEIKKRFTINLKDIPMLCNVKTGPSWGDLIEWK